MLRLVLLGMSLLLAGCDLHEPTSIFGAFHVAGFLPVACFSLAGIGAFVGALRAVCAQGGLRLRGYLLGLAWLLPLSLVLGGVVTVASLAVASEARYEDMGWGAMPGELQITRRGAPAFYNCTWREGDSRLQTATGVEEAIADGMFWTGASSALIAWIRGRRGHV